MSLLVPMTESTLVAAPFIFQPRLCGNGHKGGVARTVRATEGLSQVLGSVAGGLGL